MLMTTTSNLDGQPIRQYLGVVNGEAIIGANLFKSAITGFCPAAMVMKKLGIGRGDGASCSRC